MGWHRKVSDSEYVSKIERAMRWRKPAACFVAVMSAAQTGCLGYLFYLIQTGLMPLFDDQPAQRAFQIGAIIGFYAGNCGYFALSALLIACFSWFSKPRKDALILKYHQRLLELGELPD